MSARFSSRRAATSASSRKALASEADAVVADLEDAVAPDEKDAARDASRRCSPRRRRAGPRGSSASTASARRGSPTTWRCGRRSALDALVLPKASPEAVDGARARRAAGRRDRRDGAGRSAWPTRSASRPRVAALHARRGRSRRRGRARAAAGRPRAPLRPLQGRRSTRPPPGSGRPFDVVHLDVADDDGLEAECRLARTLGFRGKACIHPGQVADREPRLRAERARRSTWAQRVVDAFEAAASGAACSRSTGRWSTCRSSSGHGGSSPKRRRSAMQ